MDGFFGICVVKDDIKISIESWVGIDLEFEGFFKVGIFLFFLYFSVVFFKGFFILGGWGLVIEFF